MHADTYIPRRLDDQWKIGFWDVDVAAPLLFGLFMGYMSGSKFSFALCLAAAEVKVDGRGICCYAAENDTPEGRARNRRVEIAFERVPTDL